MSESYRDIHSARSPRRYRPFKFSEVIMVYDKSRFMVAEKQAVAFMITPTRRHSLKDERRRNTRVKIHSTRKHSRHIALTYPGLYCGTDRAETECRIGAAQIDIAVVRRCYISSYTGSKTTLDRCRHIERKQSGCIIERSLRVHVSDSSCSYSPVISLAHARYSYSVGIRVRMEKICQVLILSHRTAGHIDSVKTRIGRFSLEYITSYFQRFGICPCCHNSLYRIHHVHGALISYSLDLGSFRKIEQRESPQIYMDTHTFVGRQFMVGSLDDKHVQLIHH